MRIFDICVMENYIFDVCVMENHTLMRVMMESLGWGRQSVVQRLDLALITCAVSEPIAEARLEAEILI